MKWHPFRRRTGDPPRERPVDAEAVAAFEVLEGRQERVDQIVDETRRHGDHFRARFEQALKGY